MLIQKLKEINNVLDELIKLTQEDIENIKAANHNEVFANMQKKEYLAFKFKEIKNEIDNILISRNKPIEEIFTKEEEELFDEFKEKLNEFYSLHKKFSKLAFTVANFYNTLVQKIKDTKPVDYEGNAPVMSQLQIKA
jgi:predicted transcriptional regulator